MITVRPAPVGRPCFACAEPAATEIPSKRGIISVSFCAACLADLHRLTAPAPAEPTERRPCGAWTVGPSDNGWSGNTARLRVAGHELEAVENGDACFWIVRKPGDTRAAAFGHAPTLVEAQLAAQDAALSLLRAAVREIEGK